MSATIPAVIAAERKKLGLFEHPDGSNNVPGITDWYGIQGPWCAMDQSRAFFDAGFIEAVNFTTAKGFAYCPSGIAGFQKRGQWHAGMAGIRAGDVIFFDWERDGVADHVGIVEYVDASGIHTIEGNSNNRCERRLRNANIAGYGRPKYASAPAPKPPTSPHVTWKEITKVKTTYVQVPTDKNGKGVLDLKTKAALIGLVPDVDVRDHPGFALSSTRVASGDHALVVVGAPPNGRVGAYVTVAS